MKLNLHLLEFEIEHLKTPIQASMAKEKQIKAQLKYDAINQNEEKISFEDFQEYYPQLANANMPYSPYKTVLNYYQNIQDMKWYLSYAYNMTDYFTNFNILFVLGIFFICLLIFFQKKYKNFIEKLTNNRDNKNTEQVAETKKCPYCSEIILSTAKKCKYCHSKIDTFNFIKSIKFNKFLYAGLSALLILSIINNILLFIHPIIIYSVYSFLTLFDPLIVGASLILVNVIFTNIKKIYKIIGVVLTLCILMACYESYTAYIANMWDVGRLACLLATGFCFNILLIKFFKNIFSKNNIFFILWFIFTLLASSIIRYFYQPITP